jgi:SOS regulatory protein LexA
MEQKRLIDAKPNGHALIKGVAGSGKTTVAVHRLPFLLNEYCFGEDDKVLLVTYNKTLVEYISYLYKNVKDASVVNYSIFGRSKDNYSIVTIDSIIYQLFQRRNKRMSLYYEILDDRGIQFRYLADAIRSVSKDYPEVEIIDTKNNKFLLEEIEWIKACNYINLADYQSADRLGRMSFQSGDAPQKLRKDSDIREAIHELMVRYNKIMRDNNKVDFKDIALYALDEIKEDEHEKYTHILIDEVQDLTRVQLIILKSLYKEKSYSSIYFFADTAQSIYAHAWLVRGRSFTSIGYDMTGRSTSLTKNYRTTNQIAKAAYSLIEDDPNIIENENYVKPSLLDRQSVYPIYKRYKKSKDESKDIASEIKVLLKEYQARDIAIIARFSNLLNSVERELRLGKVMSSRIDRNNADFESDTVKLITMHSVKGLEFKVVFIIGVNEGIMPYLKKIDEDEKVIQESNERRLFYVGMTRARELLYISSHAVPSPFINEINSSYMQLSRNAKIKRYEKLSTESYRYINSIDIYNPKESIRQWLINQLMKQYDYPIELIEVNVQKELLEDQINIDIQLMRYANGKRVPFCIVLTSQYLLGVNSKIEDLKQLMDIQGADFGIISDGNEFLVVNNKHKVINDLPQFTTALLPQTIEKFDFVNIKEKNHKKISRDYYYPKELMVMEGSEELSYSSDETTGVAVYGQIAAGEPININEELDTFYLPSEWTNYKDSFILQVRGDSMIGTDINDGDLVLVKRQDYAKNWDIVVAVIDDTVTLKRLSKMSEMVALIAENPKYEAISIKEEELNILGIVVGVIKQY